MGQESACDQHYTIADDKKPRVYGLIGLLQAKICAYPLLLGHF